MTTPRRIAHYELLDKLGSGGMGEVWRARDARLERSVALKLLPEEFASDPSRRQRFEQEARALGALNHPNIVAIYDFGEGYLVSELVEGESLRAVLDRGPLQFRRALDIAAQIADAIAAAHALGIVHRDLKPENIMLTADGRVKVLDFGLAKRAVVETGDKTATMAISQPGVVLGTMGYMSPEQVRGDAVDSRSDIFSLGCLLYELIAGKRAFDGPSAADVMSAVLREEPEESERIPGPVAAIITRSLAKNPAQRFQSAADLAFALRAAMGRTEPHPVTPGPTPRRSRTPFAVAAALAALALIAAAYLARGIFPTNQIPRFQRLTFRQGPVDAARFNPGAESVIYQAAWEGGPNRVYLVTPGNPESRDLELPPGSRLLSVSSKGDVALLIGPFDKSGAGTLARGSVAGGAPRELLEHVNAADWSPDGSELAVLRTIGLKRRLEYPMGKPLFESTLPLLSIRVSRDGRRVALSRITEQGGIELLAIDRNGAAESFGMISNQSQGVETSGLSWAPKREEIYFRSFDAFDARTLYAAGPHGKRRVVARFPNAVTLFDVANDGRVLLSTESGRTGILGQAPGEAMPRDLSCLEASYLRGISDDGRMIVASVDGESGGAKGSIYTRGTDGSPCVRLGDGVAKRLSPDGRWVTGYNSKETQGRKNVLIPTGAGEELEASIPQLSGGTGVVAGWLEGDLEFLVFGSMPGKSMQFFAWSPKREAIRAVTPEHMNDGYPIVTPDRKRFLAIGPEGRWQFFDVSGGPGRDVEGLTPHDTPINWRADGRALYIATHRDENKTIPISLVDIATGARTPWKEIRPPMPVDEAGPFVRITPDGRAYAYDFTMRRSELNLAEGLK